MKTLKMLRIIRVFRVFRFSSALARVALMIVDSMPGTPAASCMWRNMKRNGLWGQEILAVGAHHAGTSPILGSLRLFEARPWWSTSLPSA